jgi:MFS family permease
MSSVPSSSVQTTSTDGESRSAHLVLVTASAACALIVLDTNVVAVSLPAIARTFHAGFADVEWVVSAYMVAFAACLLPSGGLADRFGRKTMLLAGLGIFALASLGCGLALSVQMLDIARAVKGLGAALLLTSALAIIANTFHGGPSRERAWAFWGACMGVATTVAPLAGGVITQWLGWRWIFLLNLPVCAMLAWSAWKTVTPSANPQAGPLDIAGGLLFGLSLALGIWGLVGTQTDGWDSRMTALRFAGSAVLMLAFIWVERGRTHPMIDLALFRQARFVGAVLAMFGYAACAQVMMTFLPLYLQNAFAFSAVAAGLGMLPFDRGSLPRPGTLDARSERRIALVGIDTHWRGQSPDGDRSGHWPLWAGCYWHGRDWLWSRRLEWRHPESDCRVRATGAHGDGIGHQYNYAFHCDCHLRWRAGRRACVAYPQRIRRDSSRDRRRRPSFRQHVHVSRAGGRRCIGDRQPIRCHENGRVRSRPREFCERLWRRVGRRWRDSAGDCYRCMGARYASRSKSRTGAIAIDRKRNIVGIVGIVGPASFENAARRSDSASPLPAPNHQDLKIRGRCGPLDRLRRLAECAKKRASHPFAIAKAGVSRDQVDRMLT